jgi:hypothetical protein
VPDFHFGLNDDLYKRVTKRFENELALWNGMKTAICCLSARSLRQKP